MKTSKGVNILHLKGKKETSGQDSSVCKHSTCLLPQPQQNYNKTTEQPSFRTTCNQIEYKSYN